MQLLHSFATATERPSSAHKRVLVSQPSSAHLCGKLLGSSNNMLIYVYTHTLRKQENLIIHGAHTSHYWHGKTRKFSNVRAKNSQHYNLTFKLCPEEGGQVNGIRKIYMS